MSIYLELVKKSIHTNNPFDPLYCYYHRILHFQDGVMSYIKYSELHYTLNKPFFINDDQRESLLIAISKIQKTYHALSKFAFICKFKMAKIAINTDLYMNQIHPGMKNVLVIFQNHTKYYFTISDLINIVKKSLSHSPFFFPRPHMPKNPYTNVAFSKCQLYNIYFAIKQSTYVMPELLQGFFNVDFYIAQFTVKYESIIRHIAISSFVQNSHFDILHPYVIMMCFQYNLQLYENIHDDFPPKQLVDIFKPFLYPYLTKNYSIADSLIVEYSHKKLKKKLQLFSNFNPNFGRKLAKMKTVNGKRIVSEIGFNAIYKPFHEL